MLSPLRLVLPLLLSIELAVGELARYDLTARRAVVDPGRYEVMLGASSSDIRKRATFDVEGP